MEHNEQSDELLACTPTTVDTACFNNQAILPYNLTVEHIHLAMDSFTAFLGYINKELYTRRLKRLESMFMQANFSSLVGEYMKSTIPTFCTNIVTNRHHNGHPDLIPIDYYPNNDVEHGSQGIEIKGSRYTGNWQGHNAEDCWLMVFVYDSNRPENAEKGIYLPKVSYGSWCPCYRRRLGLFRKKSW